MKLDEIRAGSRGKDYVLLELTTLLLFGKRSTFQYCKNEYLVEPLSSIIRQEIVQAHKKSLKSSLLDCGQTDAR
jgi:hypothetical protein